MDKSSFAKLYVIDVGVANCLAVKFRDQVEGFFSEYGAVNSTWIPAPMASKRERSLVSIPIALR